MSTIHHLAGDISLISMYEPVPGFGVLPVNVFLLKGTQNVLVDTGVYPHEADVLAFIESEVGPEGLDWVFLSHADRDHSGNLEAVLKAHPRARVIGNFPTFGKMSADFPLPLPRFYAMNPGQAIETGDRTLQVFQPPLYDAGGSLGFYDAKSDVLFGADSFGAIIPAPAVDLDEVPQEPLEAGFSLFNRANTPWVVDVEETRFAATLKQAASFGAKTVLATHLPVARSRTDELLRATAALPAQGPASMPDQAAIDAMLASMTGPA